jgi:hypothetical protein
MALTQAAKKKIPEITIRIAERTGPQLTEKISSGK